MIERKTTTVSLSPELHAFVGELVKSGDYSSVSEVMRAGLRLLRNEEAQRLSPRRSTLARASRQPKKP